MRLNMAARWAIKGQWRRSWHTSPLLRVTAPPADGAANEAVLRLLAAALGRPRRDLTLLRGATARIKLVAVALD